MYAEAKAELGTLTDEDLDISKHYNTLNLEGAFFGRPPIYRAVMLFYFQRGFWVTAPNVRLILYAEAKAELGTLTDEDLDISINKLYARAELPAQTVASLSAILSNLRVR